MSAAAPARARSSSTTARRACCSPTRAASAPAWSCSATTRCDEYFAARLGVEPLSTDFTADALRALSARAQAPVKAFLLDQERVAGVGNIYADEALFRARIHPLRPVGTLQRAADRGAPRRASSSRSRPGSTRKGASIDDFRHADGARGSFQDRFLVHRREGEPCPAAARRS